MVFNTPKYRDSMHALSNYLGSATGLSAWGWKQSGTGVVAVEKSSGEDAVFIVVGKVVDSRFRCSPIGNFNERYKEENPLWKAKYQVSVGVPDEPALGPDFNKAFDMLLQLQGTVATSADRRYLAVYQGKIRNISFSSQVFEERAVNAKPDGKDEIGLDEETRDWPIPQFCQDEFDAIKYSHRAQPLLVYKDNTFIEPDNTSTTLAGSLAEVHFTIKHYTISKASTPPFDSFTGNVEEIRILKSATPKSNKRKNPREGPVRTKAAPSGSGANIIAGRTAHKFIADGMAAAGNTAQKGTLEVETLKGKEVGDGRGQPRMTARMSTGGVEPTREKGDNDESPD